MDGGPRRWVLKPLSPLLQPSDLRTISCGSAPSFHHLSLAQEEEDSEVVEAVQVSVSEDGSSSEEGVPSSPSSDGSLSGFYSFVEDPDSPEAELNQAWMVSAQRRVQLTTLKEGQGFTLQTYSGSRRPETLFPEEDEDSCYRSQDVETSESRDAELRQEIIRSQAPRKSPENPNEPVSPYFNVPPEGIDKGQINFTVARQQFLKMEEEQLRNLLSPPRFSRTPRRFSTDTNVFSFKTEDTNQIQKDVFDSTEKSSDTQINFSSVSEEINSSLQNLSVSRDASENQTSISYETPIDREIRRALQREESLRFSRGLKSSDKPSEIIQIRRKGFFSPLRSTQPGNKSRYSFMFQRDFQNQRVEPQDNQVNKRKDSNLQEKPSTAEKLQPEPGGISQDPHFKDSEFYKEVVSSCLAEGSDSWRLYVESSGLMSRESRAPDFIHKEIQDVLRREEELRNLCRSRDKSFSSIVVEPRTRRTNRNPNELTSSPLLLRPPTNQHSVEDRARLKEEESRYAGIHPVDDINNQVVEATRVVRHKNQRTLRWEAGVFANQENY